MSDPLTFSGSASDGNLLTSQGEVWGKRAIHYPSPFFDLAQSYVPVSVKEMFKWCKFFFYKHPLVSPAIIKLAEFPITDLVYNTNQEGLKKWWKETLEDYMRFKKTAIGIGFDYHTYGNAFVSINVPVMKRLICRNCREAEAIERVKYQWRNYKFIGKCQYCGCEAEMTVEQTYSKDRSQYNFVRWDPLQIEIDYNPITGKSTYYYVVPNRLATEIASGKKSVIETIPQVYIQAVKEKGRIRFSHQNFYHFKRETLAERDQEWGKPLLYPVMTTIFYSQILQRAQEAIAVQHIVPLWILFPQATSNMDPIQMLNMSKWKTQIEDELLKWKRDPNYVCIMPMPLGFSAVGGEGRGLLLGPEQQMNNQNILAGMGVPQEFVYGGLSYTGTSVTLRMLENHLIGHAHNMNDFLNFFVVPFLSRQLGVAPIHVELSDFKMADDIQRKQVMMQLNAGGKVSDQKLLESVDPKLRFEDEMDKRVKELTRNMQYSEIQSSQAAEIQGKASVIAAKYNVQAQRIAMQAQMAMQQEQMAAQQQQMQQLQEAAANGDPNAQAQLAQMQAQQGGQPTQGQPQGQPQGQGQPQITNEQMVQLAAMPPEQLQALVQQGQVPPEIAQQAQQMGQAAQLPDDQLHAMAQHGQLPQEMIPMIQAVRQALQQQPVSAPSGDMMTEAAMDEPTAQAYVNKALPEMQSPQMKNMLGAMARQLMMLPPEMARTIQENMRATKPTMYELVMKIYNEMMSGNHNTEAIPDGQLLKKPGKNK